MNRRLLLVRLVLPCLALLAACDRGPRAELGSVRVETVPEGVAVSLDGGPPRISPALFDNLPAGVYMFSARHDGHRDTRQTLALMAGQKAVLALRLEPLSGLVLIRSTPDGAEVSVDGAFRGKTPLLIPDFPLGSRRVRLSLAGHAGKEIEVSVRDRTPVMVDVELLSRLARLDIASEPAGAAVYLDEAPRGITPCLIEQLADAPVRLAIRLDGYTPYNETVTLRSGRIHPIRAVLEPLPAELEVTSTPAGARVFLDGHLRGETPVVIPDLARGEYRLRLELRGYEPLERPVSIARAGRARETAQLVRNSGALVLITTPAEVEVFVDGEQVGVTAASPAGGAVSEPLRVDLLSRGPHTLQLVRRGFAFTPKTFLIEPNQVLQLQESLTRLFIRDTVIVLRRGDGHYELSGQLLRKAPNGDVEFAVNPGVVQLFEAAAIVEMRPLKPDTP